MSAFFETGAAQRSVYVSLPGESEDHYQCLRILHTASYELVNANTKLQVQSDNLLLNMGL